MTDRRKTDQGKICIVSTHHDDTDSRVFHKQATTLSDAGYNVTYYTPFGTEGLSKGITIRNPFSEWSRDFDSIVNAFSRLLYAIFITWHVYRDNSEYRVYHFHDPELLPFMYILQFFKSGQFIYDIHEDTVNSIQYKDIFPKYVRPIASKLVALVEAVCSKRMNGIIGASNDVLTRFQNHDNIITITNYPPKKWANRAEKSQQDGTTRIVYCGLLSKPRGILTIVEAINRIPDEYNVELILGGRYQTPEFENQVKKQANETNRVKLLGWLDSLEDVLDLFYRSDIGLMYFHRDARNLIHGAYRSNKLFQYMCAGIPICVSDIGEWANIVSESECGIPVEPENPDALANAIVDLAESPTKRERFGRNGKRAIVEKYNWETESEKLLNFYDSLLME